MVLATLGSAAGRGLRLYALFGSEDSDLTTEAHRGFHRGAQRTISLNRLNYDCDRGLINAASPIDLHPYGVRPMCDATVDGARGARFTHG